MAMLFARISQSHGIDVSTVRYAQQRDIMFDARPQTSLNPGEQPGDLLTDILPHGQEDKIAEVKFMNFLSFASVYPEYRFVFVGDSGQADALTAQRIVESGAVEGGPRVITTFIHDLQGPHEPDAAAEPGVRPTARGATRRSCFNERPGRHRVPELHRGRRHRATRTAQR